MAIYINTNQNVRINYEISSISDRLLAYLIDALVIGGLMIGIFILGAATNFGIGAFLMFIIIFFYHLISEIFMNGQSIGKRNRGIRVMKKDGRAATFSSYLLRFLLRPIDSFYGLGLAVVFLTEKNQRLGDLAAGTVVVNVKSEDELKQQIKEEMNLNLHEEIKYPQVIQLNSQDIQIIKKILHSRTEEKGHPIVLELAQKIAQKLDLEYDKDWAYYFLLRLLQDYHKSHMETEN